MTKRILFFISFFCLFFSGADAASDKGFDVRLRVTDRAYNEPVVMATCLLDETGIVAMTDLNGSAVLKNVPLGRYTLKVRYVGYETITRELRVDRSLSLSLRLTESSLALKEVTVTARQNVSGASTGSIIDRGAIDHLQATSLADIMQLVPGQLMGNADLTARTNLQLRTLVNNNTSAFGSSIVVDGVPISHNGEVSQGTFSASAFTGTDLRQIAADDISSVEVIRGIPSAEYGDLTSGLVVVHSKMGVTPYQLKLKVHPALQNYSLSKGFRTGRGDVVNVSLDYAKAWGDPRQRTRSYDRYSLNLGYGHRFNKRWHARTQLRFLLAKDWSGNDPDARADGTEDRNSTMRWTLSHNGQITLNRPLARTLGYTIGGTLSLINSRNTTFVSNPTGLLPIITAMTPGYHHVPWQTTSYRATGLTESRPINVYAKVNNDFFLRAGKTLQRFKMGLEYNYDKNSGRGYYNDDDALPYRPNSNGRPRAFRDIPGLHRIAGYVEDRFTWNINRVNKLFVNAGLRFTTLQPFSEVGSATLGPRLNVSLRISRWLELRAGIGLNTKTPGLNYLYPDKKYDDRVAANYMPQGNPTGRLLVYHTEVVDVPGSKDLKPATTTKVEAGADVRLPWGGKLSLLAYHDRTPNGFGPATEYLTYYYYTFTPDRGLTIRPGSETLIDYTRPAGEHAVMMTTGKIGNTNTTVNEGIEADFDLGEIRPLNTSFFLTGAWQQTTTRSTDMAAQSPRNALLPVGYTVYGLTPFKVVYPSGIDYDEYQRFLTTLRLVTNIPVLKMVASFATQVIWHQRRYDYRADKRPIGWIDTDLNRHDITAEMLHGYLSMNGTYSTTAPTHEHSIHISDLALTYSDAEPMIQPVTWNMSARLTKEIGKIGGLSLYVNNSLFYEPYLKGDRVNTLTQRNTGTFGFGAELYFRL